MSTEAIKPFIIAITVIGILALIFNLLGIYLLKASRLDNSFQIKIITNLSICDILILTVSMLDMVLKFNGHALLTSKVAQVVWSFRESVYYTWIMMFYLLTIDRFLGCNFPLRYRASMSPKKCTIVLGFSWGIAITLWPTFSILDTIQIQIISYAYLWLIYDGIFLCLFFVTYATVFYRKKKSNQNLGRQYTGLGNQRFFAVTSTMLVAFMLFETIPKIGSACLTMVSLEVGNVLKHIFMLCWGINLLVDPFIYILLLPSVRHTAADKLRSVCNIFRRNRISALARNDTTQNSVPTTSSITKNEKG